MNENILVAYFSWSGKTKLAAEQIAKTAGCMLFEIDTAKKYPEQYQLCIEEAKAELAQNARPTLKGALPDISGVDKLALGFPLWGNTCPMAILSFIESFDLLGKFVYPFCTHGGASTGKGADDIRKSSRGGAVKPCMDANFLTAEKIRVWLDI